MASGFLILADGRCLAVRWHYFDLTLRAVAEALDDSVHEQSLRKWLLTLLPEPSGIDELGYGAWLRSKDQQVIRKYLDVRELTLENQRLFHQAALRAGEKAVLAEATNWDPMLVDCLVHLLDMVERADRGEVPSSLSDWTQVKPPEGRKIGPGWETG